MFLGDSSGSGQSRLPDSDRDFGGGNGGGGSVVPYRRAWQFGIRDAHCLGSGPEVGGGHGHMWGASLALARSRAAGAEWRLPPMGERQLISAVGPPSLVQNRLSVRVSAFDHLTSQARPTEGSGRRPTSNPTPSGNLGIAGQPSVGAACAVVGIMSQPEDRVQATESAVVGTAYQPESGLRATQRAGLLQVVRGQDKDGQLQLAVVSDKVSMGETAAASGGPQAAVPPPRGACGAPLPATY